MNAARKLPVGSVLAGAFALPWAQGGLAVLGAIFLVIEVAALSLSYRELTSPAPQPTNLPA